MDMALAPTENILPAHIGALLQAEGMNYDPATFAAMTLEQHTEEGFKGLRVSVLAAVYAGAHFVQALELSKRLESFNRHYVKEEANRLGIAIQTIYNMIDVYGLFCRSPQQIAPSLQKLGLTKLIELKSFNQSDLEQFAEGQEVYGITLESALQCSTRELSATLKSHRAEIKNLKQRILDTERKLNTEAAKTAELFAENQAMKKLPAERNSFAALRKQTFQDMEALQGIAVRARKTLEMSQHWQKEVAADGREAVIFPLMHLLSVMHGNSKLLVDDLVMAWQLDPSIPVNPPQPDSMTHEERWAAQESARYQNQLTEMLFPTNKKAKRDKP